MSSSKLSSTQKAAIVLLSLGEDISADVFKAMQPSEIKALSNTISRLGHLDENEINDVLKEFETVLEDPHTQLVGNYDIAKSLIDRAFESRSPEMLAEINLQKEATIDCLDVVDPKSLATFLNEEHPQTIALIMAHLNPAKFADTLQHIPHHMHTDILRRIVSLEYPSPEVINDLNKILNFELRIADRRDRSFGGAEHVARALHNMPRNLQVTVLKELETQSPAVAGQISDLMFTFEDLTKIDNLGLQEIIKIVDSQIWVTALRSASESLKEHIFRNMSERRREILLEDMQESGRVRFEDIKNAQSEIVRVAKALELEGKISIVHNPYERTA